MFYDNLKRVCDEKGVKITPIVAECGGAKGSISNWKNGASPNSDIIAKLSVRLNVSTDMLIFGEERKLALPSDEQELLESYQQLPEREQMKLIGRAAALAEVYKEQIEESKPPIISIYCSQNRVSAGIGEDLFDYEQWDTVDVIETYESRKADFMLIVAGESMSPKFHDGDHVLVRQQPAVELGQIGIFYVDGKGYIKKYDGDYLISLNPDYDDIYIVNKELRCFGLVLGIAELA